MLLKDSPLANYIFKDPGAKTCSSLRVNESLNIDIKEKDEPENSIN